jgi:hypothetical protein
MTPAELLAALLAAGLDPVLAANAVTIQELRLRGAQQMLFGLVLPRAQAILLRERIAALEEQYKKQLVTDAETTAALAALGIPTENARALQAQWAAAKVAASTHAVKLPRE